MSGQRNGAVGGPRPAIVRLADRTVIVGEAEVDGPWLNVRGRRLSGGVAVGPDLDLTVGPAEVRRVRYTDR